MMMMNNNATQYTAKMQFLCYATKHNLALWVIMPGHHHLNQPIILIYRYLEVALLLRHFVIVID